MMREKKLTKLLGLSTLAMVAVMAVGASAAHAVYKLNGGSESGGVLLLHLEASFWGLSEILDTGLNVHVHCEAGLLGFALVHIVSDATMTNLTTSMKARWGKCTVKGFSTCTVNSPGLNAGELSLEGKGNGAMSGTETYAKLSSANLSEYGFHGATCPFDELEGQLSGELKLGLQGESTESTHSATLDDIAGTLKYGEEEAALHGANLSTPVALTLKKVGGGNWGISL